MNLNEKRTKSISKCLIAVFIFSHLLPIFSTALWAESADTETASSSLSSESSEVVLVQESEESPEEGSSSNSIFLTPPSSNEQSVNATSTDTTSTASSSTDTTATSTTSFEETISDQEFQSENGSSTETIATPTSTSSASIATTTEEMGTFTTSSTTTPSTTATIEASSTTQTTENSTTTIEGTLPSGTTTIATGDSVALANLLNIVNTSLVNSTGSVVLQNLTNETDTDIDLRTPSTGTSSCTLLACNGISTTTIQMDATSTITNDITLLPTSGQNTIETAENAVIQTGAAFAGLNLINIANTNLVDSTYLLLGLNAFNDVNGDIVFPSIANFFNSPTAAPTAGSINLKQTGSIINNLDIQADAGNNQALDTQTGTIATGNAVATTNVYNALNGTFIGGSSVQVLLRVSGEWLGNLFGAPEGIGFTNEGDTRVLNLSTPGSLSSAITNATSNILSTSTALINNQVQMIAESGINETKDTAHTIIETGDALAAANIINIANTNVIGRNWILAIINIFGNFRGNIAFGRPDLWLGAQVHGNAPVQNASELTYTITVANRGDSQATQAVVTSQYDADHLTIVEASLPYEDNGSSLTFQLGTLAPGQSKEITFKGSIKNAPQGLTINNTSTVVERETDNNPADNTDTVGIQTYTDNTVPTTLPSGTTGGSTVNTNGTVTSIPVIIQVQRLTATSTLTGNDKGEQTIVVRNLTSNPLLEATFEDILIDPQGKEVQRQSYELGTIKPYEEITISYDISFGDAAKEGTYRLSSELRYSPDQLYTFTSNGSISFIKGKTASAPQAQVLGVATTTAKIISTTKASSHRAISTTHTTNDGDNEKGSVLGAFVESFSPEIAYAEDAGKTVGGIDWNYWIMSLIIILLIIAMLLYRRYLASKEKELA